MTTNDNNSIELTSFKFVAWILNTSFFVNFSVLCLYVCVCVTVSVSILVCVNGHFILSTIELKYFFRFLCPLFFVMKIHLYDFPSFLFIHLSFIHLKLYAGQSWKELTKNFGRQQEEEEEKSKSSQIKKKLDIN